ncbi:hypothetical protein [Streptomyces rimosus]|uniref:hypothetical protein n=1 Tax=Streptomyces rimosus TaxID=1927 RepID=UPI00131BFC4A|nr:hypothetical protein [Streptomyces rimosus]
MSRPKTRCLVKRQLRPAIQTGNAARAARCISVGPWATDYVVRYAPCSTTRPLRGQTDALRLAAIVLAAKTNAGTGTAAITARDLGR